MEIVSAAGAEAKAPQDLRFPAKYIAPVISGLYLLLALMFAFDVSWQDPELPRYFGIKPQSRGNETSEKSKNQSTPKVFTSNSVLIIAVLNSGIPKLPGFLVAALTFINLSAASVALYVASRTIHSLARTIDTTSRSLQQIAKLRNTNARGVPGPALIVSALLLGAWLPALHYAKQTPSLQEVILMAVGSV